MQQKLLFIVLIVHLLGSCSSSESPQASTKEPVAERPLLLDNIDGLVQQQKLYAAHSALVHYRLQFPESHYQSRIDSLHYIIRQSFNAQQFDLTDTFSDLESGGIKLRKEVDDTKQRIFYHAPQSTLYVNEDAVQAYLSIPFDSTANPLLQFTVQNVSERRYQLTHLQFTLDGIVYPYLPERTYDDEGYGYYWQWFDDPIIDNNVQEVLEKVVTAKNAKVTLFFQQNYREEREITIQEKEALNTILIAWQQTNSTR